MGYEWFLFFLVWSNIQKLIEPTLRNSFFEMNKFTELELGKNVNQDVKIVLSNVSNEGMLFVK